MFNVTNRMLFYLLLSFINEKIILENLVNSYFVFSSSVCNIVLIIRLLSETLFVTGETGPIKIIGFVNVIIIDR